MFCWDLILIYIGFKFLDGAGSLGVVDNISRYLWRRIENSTRQIEVEFFAHLHNLSLRWHLSRKTGEVVRVMEQGPWSFVHMLYWLLFNIIPTLVDIVIAVVFFSSVVDWYFGLMVLASMALYIRK